MLQVIPPVSSLIGLKKLVHETVSLSQNASLSELEFAQRVDHDELQVLYEDFIVPNHLRHLWKIPKRLYSQFMRFIVSDAKFQFPTKRPFTLAKAFKIPFTRPFKTSRSKGSSYPSGHAASIWFVAYYLAPKLTISQKRTLFRLANKMCRSRMIAGVHTTQDIKEAKRLAKVFLQYHSETAHI